MSQDTHSNLRKAPLGTPAARPHPGNGFGGRPSGSQRVKAAVRNLNFHYSRKAGHRADRAFGLRQDDLFALLQPHA
jgi:hypothetical protein